MDIPPLQPRATAANVPLEKLASNPNVSDAAKVAEASRQFEAVFLRQILQEARKSMVNSSANPETATKGIYDDLVNNQLADSISRSGEFGLAKSLQTQLARQVLPHAGAKSEPHAGVLSKTNALNH
jgi:flagellar protein FlgJ